MGKFHADDSVKLALPSNLPKVTVGVSILRTGWFGLSWASQLARAGTVVAVFVVGPSMLVWLVTDKTLGSRASISVEVLGQDVGEFGIEAYPEFVVMPDEDD